MNYYVDSINRRGLSAIVWIVYIGLARDDVT